MFKNYIKISFRNLWKHRGYSFINISGLAVGIACCLLIVLYIQDELNYDRHHVHVDETYRVTLDLKLPGAEYNLASTMAILGPTLKDDLPEITQYTRLSRDMEFLVTQEERRFYETGFYFADSTVFDVFTYPLLRGDVETALNAPFSVLLTEEMAQKYFGDTDPMGQVLRIDNEFDFTVAGILAPLPSHSHFSFDFLASMTSLEQMDGEMNEWNDISDVHTYIVIPGSFALEAMDKKVQGVLHNHAGEENSAVMTLHLQPLTDIHLSTGYANENSIGGNSMTNLYVFGSIALLILLIASINFINLSTARSVKRAREVGMRKVLGAYRLQLIRQFLGESVLLAFLGLLFALGLVELLVPAFNSLLDTNLVITYFGNSTLLLSLLAVVAFVGVVAGTYPAFVLSSFRPVEVFKGETKRGVSGVLLRKGLVVFQFAIAIVLIIGSFIMSAQMTYFAEKDLGFNKEQVVVMNLREPAVQDNYESFKRTLSQHPGILHTAAASSMPGSNTYGLGSFRVEGAPEDDEIGITTVVVDHDFVETLELTMASGRNFSRDFVTDSSATLLLNEAAVARLALEDPLTTNLITDDDEVRQVVGVIEDFHFSTLQTEIRPIVFYLGDSFPFLAARIDPKETVSVMEYLEASWAEVAPAYPFEYTFMDDDFANAYEGSQRLSNTIQAFTFLAILVACLGLFGLVSYTTEQRTKEIGVRKVLGASVPGILVLLSKDFLKLVGVAFVIAGPLAYFTMQKWLEEFAYRIEISWAIFLMAGIAALMIAVITVCYQAIRAALANPVESLRYE